MLGYKVAKSFDKRVVITLEIPEDAITNVKRTNIVHAETAKYRTNKAKVIKIEDIDGKTYEEAVSFQYYNGTLTYNLKQGIRCPDFDMNLEKVCSNGIHFFLSKQMAETYNLGRIENGVGTSWHDNGNEYIQITYVNGLATACDEWYENGTKYREYRYLNGKLNGVQRSWYEDGKKQTEYTYENDVEHGHFHKWSRNGERLTIIYINGREAVDCCVIA